MNEMVAAEGVSKGFQSGSQRLQVLSGLSIRVGKGEMVAVTGASGSGKSTLLHLLGAMDRPDSGSIRIQGTELTALSLLEAPGFRNRTVGFVFQFHHLLPEFSALENVMMPLLLRGEPHHDARRDATRLLAEVGLEGRGHHRPGELSGGEQQRVAVARALVGNPPLLLADEPTGNLDPHTGASIAQMIRELHETRRLTSILVTHNENLAGLCTRIHRLVDGRLV